MSNDTRATAQRSWLTSDAALVAIGAAQSRAIALEVSVVVHVADPSGNAIALLRMDDAPLFSIEVAAKKAWTAAAAKIPTSTLREVFNADPTLLHALAPKVDNLMAVGGATPIFLNGSVVGSVGVSGATEEQDQEIADAAVTALGLNR